VHGGLGDHTRWDALRAHLEPNLTVFAMDRRGRGASTDGPDYALEREYEDVAAVIDAIGGRTGQPVTGYGHSYGGLCLFGAAPLTSNLGRLALYEGWPPPDPQAFAPSTGLRRRLETLLAEGEVDTALELILSEVVGMTHQEIATYRADPSWSGRLAAAPTFPREEEAFATAEWSPEAAARIRVPTLILTGDQTPPWRAHADEVVEALPNGRLVALTGQGHSADIVAPALVASALRDFITPDAHRRDGRR
jgi:pimeloyl-ACP methyl ester carboxylesterase